MIYKLNLINHENLATTEFKKDIMDLTCLTNKRNAFYNFSEAETLTGYQNSLYRDSDRKRDWKRYLETYFRNKPLKRKAHENCFSVDQ